MKKPLLTRKELIPLGAIIAFFAAASAVLLLFPLGGPSEKWLPKCMFYKLTGLYCPGCGATRALSAILHGDLKASLHNNLLLIPGTLTATMLIVKQGITVRRPVAIAIVAIIIAFTVLRNIPCEPFTLLAPIPPHP